MTKPTITELANRAIASNITPTGPTMEPPPKKRRVRSASVVAIDKIAFILSDLTPDMRRTVLHWMQDEYGESRTTPASCEPAVKHDPRD